MNDQVLIDFLNRYHITVVRYQGLWVAKAQGLIADGVSLRDALESLTEKSRRSA